MSENLIYILYDILIDNSLHSYNVENEQFDKSQISYISGNDAIIAHNKRNTCYRVDNLVDQSCVDFRCYKYNKKTYSYVCIDSYNLECYYEKHNNIPNEQLIIDAYINSSRYSQPYDMKYKIIASDGSKNPDINTINICNKVIIPTDNICDAMIEQPDFIKDDMRLYNYQKRTINWMINTEKNRQKVPFMNYNSRQHDIGSFIVDTANKTIYKKKASGFVHFNGGALIDEVGLGKTIQMITLSLSNRLPLSQMSYIEPNYKMLKSRATLIICPNQLCGQWKREISNWVKYTDLKIVPILTKVHFDNCTYQTLLDADFVIVSYNFIGNKCFSQHYLEDVGEKTINMNNVSKVHDNKMKNIKEMIENINILAQKKPLIHLIHWHRIIIDEFHEINTVEKYKYLLPFVKLLDGTYKWVVTGTPFDKSNECFYEMIKFVTNIKSNDEINELMKNKSIYDHLENNFFKRNTKKSVEDEFKLPELCEKNIWMKFTQTERMLYNSYKANPNVTKYSETLRQMCCHPKIIDEMRNDLSECKTLEDVEKSMVRNYRMQYLRELNRVYKMKHSLARAERHKLYVFYSIQRRLMLQLKKQHERIKYKIVLPDLVLETHPLLEEYKLEIAKKNKAINKENNEDDEDEENEDLNDEDLNDEDVSEDEYEIITIDGSADIQNMIKNKIGSNKFNNIINNESYVNILTIIEEKKLRLKESQSVADGKKTSYEFYKNMLERISQITEKSKEKYMNMLNGEDSDSDDDDDDADVCGICLNSITGNDVGVTKCGHFFCYECIKLTLGDAHSNKKCPTCMKPQQIKDVSIISFEKPVLTKENYKTVQSKLDLINNIGTKLTNLVYYLNSIQDHVIIFSQWDNLLRMVGSVLSDHGIKNVYCRGNVWSRDKTIREFNSDSNVRVIMLSSESAASGTNLTKASKVIFLDPISGDAEYRKNVAWQAIGRAYRLGQKNKVEIVNLIIKDTIEEEIYKENKEADKKNGVQLLISEISDDEIKLSDEKITHIQTAINQAFDKQKERKKKTIVMKGKNLKDVKDDHDDLENDLDIDLEIEDDEY